MSVLWIPEEPGGFRNAEGSAIRAPAISARLPLHAAMRLNWLLARGASLVFEQWWATGLGDLDSRIYHRRSLNANNIFVVALIQNASVSPGSISITPAGGSTYTKETLDTASASAWGDPGWEAWVVALPLTSSGLQYHALITANLNLRYLGVWELVRGGLDTAVDTMVALSSGAYAGLEAGRWIADGSAASIADILVAIGSAKTATQRHGGGVIFSDIAYWTAVGTSPVNLADTTLATSGFGFPFRSRRFRASDTDEKYSVRVCARALKGSPETVPSTGKVYLASGTDSVQVSVTSGTWAWYAQDSGTLDVDCQASDLLVPTGNCDELTGWVDVQSIQVVPA